MRAAFTAMLVVLAAALAASCASAQAKGKSPVERPPLEVPPVPPRVIEPVPLTPPPPEPVPDLPSTPSAAKPRPQPQREPAKPPEQPKTETPPPEGPPTAPPAVAPPVPPLRTTATPDVTATRQVIDRAQAALNFVDYRLLNREQQAQYESAKLFLKQAEESLKNGNYDFARNLADKAERIAKELSGK